MKDNNKKLDLLVPNEGDDISITIGRNDIEGSKVVKLLGVKIDNKLRFDDHAPSLCKSEATCMCRSKLKILMKSFILSQFGYCPIVWMFHSRTLNHRINRIHGEGIEVG